MTSSKLSDVFSAGEVTAFTDFILLTLYPTYRKKKATIELLHAETDFKDNTVVSLFVWPLGPNLSEFQLKYEILLKVW